MVAQFKPRNPLTTALPPCSIEAEESILGGLMLDPLAFPRIINILEPHHFYVSRFSLIYKRLKELYQARGTCDFILATQYLTESGDLEHSDVIVTLSQLLERCVSAVNIDRYAELVISKWVRRETIALGNELVQFAYNNDGDPNAPRESKGLLGTMSGFLEKLENKIQFTS